MEELRGDRELATIALKQNGEAIDYVMPNLTETDLEVVRSALTGGTTAI